MALRLTIFGRPKAKANTFIGGVSATVNTPAVLAGRLGISVSRIKAFSIKGSNIQFAVTGGTYSIASFAFSGITSLTYFRDTNGLVTSINAGAFYACSNAVEYYFPAVTAITSTTANGNSGTFQNNTSCVSFSFPSLVSLSGTGAAFDGNSACTTFSAPSLSGTIPLYSFRNNSNLISITLGAITAIQDSAFMGNVKMTGLDLSTATSIGAHAFNGNVAMNYVNNMNNVVTISTNAFRGCTSLPAFSANSVSSIGIAAFYNCSSVTSYYLPALTTFETSTSAGTSGTFQNNTSCTSFSAPNLTSITGAGGAFNGNSNMTSCNVPSLAGTIGIYIWLGCSKLSSLTIGAVTTLGDGCFNGCSLLGAVYIPTLATCGSTTGNNNVFNAIKTGCVITVKASLQTANSGAPDGDLVYAATTRGATIVYV